MMGTAQLDPCLMRTFRGKMCNPRCFTRVYNVLRSYGCGDLRRPECAYAMIDKLSECCGVCVTPEQRENAAQWLMNCNVDPQNPAHQREMWNLIKCC